MLKVLETLPAGLLEAEPARLYQLLDGPALIHLQGRREPPLFVSVLLHGNETSGWYAVQALLRRYTHRPLPRSLSLFIGNVAAARYNLRRLGEQPDYNRIWTAGQTSEHLMAQQVVADMGVRGFFASVDVHNNTGHNPHYACISRLDQRSLYLAALFSRTVVYALRPPATQRLAFTTPGPAVTLECGQPGSQRGVAHVLDCLEGCLHLAEFPQHPVAFHDIDLLHTVATVKVPEDVSFGFGECGRELCFILNLDHLNFRELPAGTLLARVNRVRQLPLSVENESGEPVMEHFFTLDGEAICTVRPVIPAMLTLDERSIRQDYLGYLMEWLTLEQVLPGKPNTNSPQVLD